MKSSKLAAAMVAALALCAFKAPDQKPHKNSGNGRPVASDGSGVAGSSVTGDAEAVRFMQQATFGASSKELDELKNLGYSQWILKQAALPASPYLPRILEHQDITLRLTTDEIQRLFWERAIHGDDQLRQRMAYALSQIVVVSTHDRQVSNHLATVGRYADILQENALGNYCEMIREVTYNPAMGLFLTHLGNRKADPETGFSPDENYAREVMQLFTIGVEELDQSGRPKGGETYTLDDVQGMAAILTGLSWAGTDFEEPEVTDKNRFVPMKGFRAQHESAPKSFLGTTVNFGSNPEADIDAALDHLLDHPNVAPFVSKQLIQKLVTSNPSPNYVRRVARAFEAGRYTLPDGSRIGTGKRCDLAATAAAILTDREAREGAADPSFGKVRSPVLRLAYFLRTYRDPRPISRSGLIPQARDLAMLSQGSLLGQNAFDAPSVFSYYRPDYVAPGTESAEAGLVTPEMQLATTPGMVGYINTMMNYIDGPPRFQGEPGIADIDYDHLRPLAKNPEQLVDAVAGDLIGGTLSERNRAAIIDAVKEVRIRRNDVDRSLTRRVRIAILMTVVSPEYMVQR